MTSRLTIRLGETSVVSRDDGWSVELPADVAACIERQLPTEELTWGLGGLTASALATVAEARRVSPDESAMPIASVGAEAPDGDRISLGAVASDLSHRLTEVLEWRCSERSLGGSVPLSDLAAVLCRTDRVRRWGDVHQGVQWTSRPAPSAGGRHPCDLLVASRQVDGLAEGWWAFDGTLCELRSVDLAASSDQCIDRIAQVAELTDPALVVFVVADFMRTLSRYAGGTALVWRDVGVVLAHLHLVATDLQLPSCIVGLTGVAADETWPIGVVDAGALAVGGRRLGATR
jgi:SagB-type dehydrogenase family enzyme